MIFTVECVMKIIGLGLKDFVKDSFNIFDLVIVLMSLAEMTA